MDPGATALKKALESYSFQNGLPFTSPSDHNDDDQSDDEVPGGDAPTASIEDFDKFQVPERVVSFKAKTHGFSPSRLTAVDIAHLSLLDAGTLSQVKETLGKMAESNHVAC